MNANNKSNASNVTSTDLKSIIGFPTTSLSPMHQLTQRMFPAVRRDAKPAQLKQALSGCDELTIDFLFQHTGRVDRQDFVDRLLRDLRVIDYYPNTVANIIRTAIMSFNYDWGIFLPVLTQYFNLKRIESSDEFGARPFYNPDVFMMFDYFCGLINNGVVAEGVLIPATKTINDLVRSSPVLYWSSDEFHRMQVKTLRSFVFCRDLNRLLEAVERVSQIARRIDDACDHRYAELLEGCLRNFEDVCIGSEGSINHILLAKLDCVSTVDNVVCRLKYRKDQEAEAFNSFRRWVYPYGESMYYQRFNLDDISQTFTPVEIPFGSVYDYEFTLKMCPDSPIPEGELEGWREAMLSHSPRFKPSCPIGIQNGLLPSNAIYVPTTSTTVTGRYKSTLVDVTLPSHHARIRMFVLNGGRELPEMTYLIPNEEISGAMNP